MYVVKRKSTILEMILGIVIIAIIFVAIPGFVGYMENHYNRENCTIIEINEEYAVAEDKAGYTWSWYIDGTDMKVGDVVTLKMHTAYTDGTISDDEVIGVK